MRGRWCNSWFSRFCDVRKKTALESLVGCYKMRVVEIELRQLFAIININLVNIGRFHIFHTK